MVIKIDQVLKGKEFPLKLDQEFEIKAGIIVTLKPPTYALVKAFDAAGLAENDNRTPYEAAMERVKIVVNAPKEIDWEEVLMPMIYAIHDFHLRLCFTIRSTPAASSET